MFGGFLAVIIFNIGGLRDALHGIMRFVKVRVGKAAGIGRDQRNVPVHGQGDQSCFRRHFDRVFATGQFDIEPPRKMLLQQGKIGFGLALLLFRDQVGQRALATAGQGDQTSAVTGQKIHCNMGFQLAGPVEMRGGDQLAEIFISLGVLRKERQPVENRPGRVGAARPRNPQETACNRLHALGATAVVESHRREQANPVAKRNCRKAALFGCNPDRRGLHGTVQNRIGRKGA